MTKLCFFNYITILLISGCFLTKIKNKRKMIDYNLVRILNNIAILLDIKGENPFKTRAYSNAAEIITEQCIDVESAVSDGTLAEIKGFGEALQKKITEYVTKGKMSYYENLIKELPESIVDITKISTIGPKKAKQLFDNLGISNLDELEQACIDDKLAHIKGFSAKSQEMILNSVSHKKAAKGKHLQDAAINDCIMIEKKLSDINSIHSFSIAGGFRRFEETTSSLKFVISTSEIEKAVSELIEVFKGDYSDPKLTFTTKNNFLVELILTDINSYGHILHLETGNEDYIKAYNTHLDTNVTVSSNETSLENEQVLFEKAGLQFIPPELRESGRAIEAAKNNEIPELITDTDLKGMLHVHTNWSDGKNTIEEMAMSARKLGFKYIAICDHSKSAAYANGLSIDRVKAQHEEIDKLNEQNLGIHILKGIESDILIDGSLDYPDNILESFEIIVGSVHSNFNLKSDDMTRRICYALMSPYLSILGHPTGRLLLSRQAYELDIEEVIGTAIEYHKIIEINSNPYRLDLSWQNALYGRDRGLILAINPDSHTKDSMHEVFIGVKSARKAWLEPKHIINCLTQDEFISKMKKNDFYL